MSDTKKAPISLTRCERVAAAALECACLHGARWHDRSLPGTPDLVLARMRLAVFASGCFWRHHQGCSCARVPRSNPDFWTRKFQLNKARDRRVREALEQRGWRTLTIWECATLDGSAEDIAEVITGLLAGGFRHAEVWSPLRRPDPRMER